MPESRDRLSRPLDIATIFARRRANIIGVLDDELESALFGPVARRDTTASTSTTSGGAIRFATPRGRRVVRGRFGSPRTVIGRGRGRNLYRSPAAGVENTPPGPAQRLRGRPSRSDLPSWYPRAPLRDITAVMRAIQRRRDRLGENEGQQIEGSNPPDQLLPDPSMFLSSAQLEHGASVSSSSPAVDVKLKTPAASKVPRILLDISSKSGESEFVTPQKKLLDSIDEVEKVVKDELQKFRRTPSAKKAERERKVRSLMSMR